MTPTRSRGELGVDLTPPWQAGNAGEGATGISPGLLTSRQSNQHVALAEQTDRGQSREEGGFPLEGLLI